jgi:cephalosporin hydroxylase
MGRLAPSGEFAFREKETVGATTAPVFLDSNHSEAHVSKELALYSRLVTVGRTSLQPAA